MSEREQARLAAVRAELALVRVALVETRGHPRIACLASALAKTRAGLACAEVKLEAKLRELEGAAC